MWKARSQNGCRPRELRMHPFSLRASQIAATSCLRRSGHRERGTCRPIPRTRSPARRSQHPAAVWPLLAPASSLRTKQLNGVRVAHLVCFPLYRLPRVMNRRGGEPHEAPRTRLFITLRRRWISLERGNRQELDERGNTRRSGYELAPLRLDGWPKDFEPERCAGNQNEYSR